MDGWGDSKNLPEGWTYSRYYEDLNKESYLPGGWTDLNNSGSSGDDNNPPEGWKDTHNKRSNNITIKRNNNYILASHLQTIFVTNQRSFFPK